MDKFAVIQTGGKQYRVREGEIFEIEKLGKPVGDKVTFDKVLMLEDGTTTQIGTPYLEGVKVEASVVSEKKGKKVLGVRYKAKSNRRTKYGHRQIMTKVKIEKIG